MAEYTAPLVAGLMGIQLMPGMVMVTRPLAKVGSSTSTFREPSSRRGANCLATSCRPPLPPGNDPLHSRYSA